MKKQHIFCIIPILLASVICNLIFLNTTYADEITSIAGFTELNKCYTKGYIKKDVGKLKKGFHAEDIYASSDGDGKAAIPNSYLNTIKDGDLSCKQLVHGYDDIGQKWTGIISGAPTLSKTMETADATNWLKKMGYKNEGSGSGSGTCAKIGYLLKEKNSDQKNPTWKDKEIIYTNALCVDSLSSGKVTKSSKFSVTTSTSSFHDKLPVVKLLGGKSTVKVHNTTIGLGNGTKWSDIVDKMYTAAAKKTGMEWNQKNFLYKAEILAYEKQDNLTEGVSEEDYDLINSSWVFDGTAADAANKAISNNSNYKSASDLKFTEAQRTTLYQHYFKNFYKAKLICEGDDEYEKLSSSGSGDLTKADNITSQKCYAKAGEIEHSGNKKGIVHGIKKDMTWYTDLTFAQLVAAMTEDELLTAEESGDPDGGDEDAAKERELDCHTNAGAMGWILCPAAEAGSVMVEKTYSGLIEPYLKIDAILFDANAPGGAAVRNIWSLFQGFANLAFVIVFLFVIFSQLTGVGIDNYGIKKILPKLIIGAVLINLSFIICQLAVDLANILGTAIGSMFKNMATDIDAQISNLSVNLNPEMAQPVSGKFEPGVIAIVGIAAILGVGAFYAIGLGFIIPALLTLLSIVVGIMFLFIMLALRQALAVLLVVVSPMAFAAYILPNTKKLFDKWLNAFKGLLIAYPACSALVYGGDFVSKILLLSETSAGANELTSLGIVLSAAAVAIAPIFFIPSIIRKGMDGIAGLGSAFGRMQHGVNAPVQRAARGYLESTRLGDRKRMREEERNISSKGRRDAKRVKKAKRWLDTKGKNPDELSDTNRARWSAYQQAIIADNRQRREISDYVHDSMDMEELQKSVRDGFNNGDTAKLHSALTKIGQISQEKFLDMIEELSQDTKWATMSAQDTSAMRTTLMSQNGNPIAQVMGKMLGSGDKRSLRQMFTETDEKGNIEGYQKIRDMGNSAMMNMDKDTMEWLGKAENAQYARAFSAEQMAAGVGAGYTGVQGSNYAGMIANYGNSDAIVAQLSGAQLASGTTAMAAALSGADKQELKTVIEDASKANSAVIQSKLGTQIAEINSSAELSAKTSTSLANTLGVNKNKPQEVTVV